MGWWLLLEGTQNDHCSGEKVFQVLTTGKEVLFYQTMRDALETKEVLYITSFVISRPTLSQLYLALNQFAAGAEFFFI